MHYPSVWFIALKKKAFLGGHGLMKQAVESLLQNSISKKLFTRNDNEEIVLQLQIAVGVDGPAQCVLNGHQQQMHLAVANRLRDTSSWLVVSISISLKRQVSKQHHHQSQKA